MWVIPAKPKCYLRMFPDVLNQEKAGEVFRLQCSIAADPAMEVDREKWDDCQDCHYYRHCYDFGMAALQLLSRREGKRLTQ